MVMYTTLIFRIDNDDLSGETIRFFNVTANHRFYAIALNVLLASTSFAVAADIGCPSRVQKAQRAIAKLTKKSPATLEQGAKTSQARDRIRAAATAVLKSQSSLQRLSLVAREAANAVLAVEAIFEELDSKSAPTGTITPDEITGWWASAEPPDKFDAKSGQPQAVTSYSRVDSLRKTLDELISTPGERMDRDDFEGVLEILLQEDFEEVSDSSTGKVHYLNKVNRKTMWTLPSVGDWLTELHNATPPQLKLPESAATATSGPASVQRQDTNQGVEANPLFQQGGKLERRPQQATTVANNASLEQIRAVLRAVVPNKPDLTAHDRAELLQVVETENDREVLLEICADEGISVLAPDAVLAADIFRQVDTDGSGGISFEQFSVWWSARQLATQGALNEDTMVEMRRVWDECDEDGNGQLDLDQFGAVLDEVAESEWCRAVDPSSGRPYFYHKVTKETRWVETNSVAMCLTWYHLTPRRKK